MSSRDRSPHGEVMTPTAPLVVVGDDGSTRANDAVNWAALHASESSAVLRLVHVAHVPVMSGLGWKVDASLEAGRLLHAVKAAGQKLAQRRRVELAARYPGLRVDAAVVLGDPRDVLARETTTADLLVVGTRGHGPVPGLLLGSVSAFAVRHAACPVVVHREPAEAVRAVFLVVHAGDDPTAFRLAASYAATHGYPLRILRESGSTRERERADQAWQQVDAEIGAFRAAHPAHEVAFEEVAHVDVEGVTTASAGQALLVVERRRNYRPALDPAIAVAEHSHCPVAVVPRRTTDASGT